MADKHDILPLLQPPAHHVAITSWCHHGGLGEGGGCLACRFGASKLTWRQGWRQYHLQEAGEPERQWICWPADALPTPAPPASYLPTAARPACGCPKGDRSTSVVAPSLCWCRLNGLRVHCRLPLLSAGQVHADGRLCMAAWRCSQLLAPGSGLELALAPARPNALYIQFTEAALITTRTYSSARDGHGSSQKQLSLQHAPTAASVTGSDEAHYPSAASWWRPLRPPCSPRAHPPLRAVEAGDGGRAAPAAERHPSGYRALHVAATCPTP